MGRSLTTIREKAIPDDWPPFNAMSPLGRVLTNQARYVEAEPLVVQGFEGLEARAATTPAEVRGPRLPEAAWQVVWFYEAWGKPGQARAWKARLGLADLPKDVLARP